MRHPLAKWLIYRISRIPRKLRLTLPRARWLWLDFINEIKISVKLRFLRRPIRSLNHYERRIDSQNGEDGIIEAVFAKIGTTDKYFVEFGSGDGTECNTLLLRRWNGWRGLWMDSTYQDSRGVVVKESVTAENIQALLEKHRVPRSFDLLSIDIDGNDCWVWKAITDYKPRVVIIEYNASVPPAESRSIAYDPHFVWTGTDYFGASLLALARLGKEKGYCLVACDNSGTNAFFIKEDLIVGNFLKQDVHELYRPPTCYGGKGHPKDPHRTMIEVPFK